MAVVTERQVQVGAVLVSVDGRAYPLESVSNESRDGGDVALTWLVQRYCNPNAEARLRIDDGTAAGIRPCSPGHELRVADAGGAAEVTLADASRLDRDLVVCLAAGDAEADARLTSLLAVAPSVDPREPRRMMRLPLEIPEGTSRAG